MLPVTTQGSPGVPGLAMLAPSGRSGAPSTKNGPSTVDSGAVGLAAVVDEVDQHRHAERVRHQDELLALVVAPVADLGEEFHPGEPFLLGRPHLAHEGVQVLDEALHHLLEARVLGPLEPAQHFRRQGLLVEILDRHGRLLMSPSRRGRAPTARDASAKAIRP